MITDKPISYFFAEGSTQYAIVRLLKGVRSYMEYVITISYDLERGYAKIKLPTRYHFRLCDALVRQFAYTGISFDLLVIDPKYKHVSKTAEASNVELHLYVNRTNEENRMLIKFKR